MNPATSGSRWFLFLSGIINIVAALMVVTFARPAPDWLGRKVARMDWTPEQWREADAASKPGAIRTLLVIGVAVADMPDGMSLFGNRNKTFIPEFEGPPLEELFPSTIEPFVAAVRAGLIASGELPADA